MQSPPDAADLLAHLVDHVTRAEPPASSAPARPSPSIVPNPGQVRVQLYGEGPWLFLKITCISEAGDPEAERSRHSFHSVLRGCSSPWGFLFISFYPYGIVSPSQLSAMLISGPAADVEITALYELFNQLPQCHQSRLNHLLHISPSDSIFLIKF